MKVSNEIDDILERSSRLDLAQACAKLSYYIISMYYTPKFHGAAAVLD
jgi:hypothetical protein